MLQLYNATETVRTVSLDKDPGSSLELTMYDQDASSSGDALAPARLTVASGAITVAPKATCGVHVAWAPSAAGSLREVVRWCMHEGNRQVRLEAIIQGTCVEAVPAGKGSKAAAGTAAATSAALRARGAAAGPAPAAAHSLARSGAAVPAPPARSHAAGPAKAVKDAMPAPSAVAPVRKTLTLARPPMPTAAAPAGGPGASTAAGLRPSAAQGAPHTSMSAASSSRAAPQRTGPPAGGAAARATAADDKLFSPTVTRTSTSAGGAAVAAPGSARKGQEVLDLRRMR